MEKFICGVAGIITGLLAAYICKVDAYEVNKDSRDTKLGITTLLCFFDIRLYEPHGFGEYLIASIITLITFVVIYYVIYGIMSVLKISGENVADRHSKAFWGNLIISMALTFIGFYV